MDLGFFERAKRITSWVKEALHSKMSLSCTRSYRGRWTNLPEVVLTEVFKYLSDHDKLNAAMVCFSWYKIFESPCLWRRRHFDMGGFRAQTNGYRACRFADRFGQYLRYLSMSCSHPSFHTCKQFQNTIEELFGKFKEENTQLHEFEFCRLELDRYWKYDTPREKVIGIFSKFFKTQKALRCFDMSCSQFPAYGGCRILESIAYQSGDTVQDMIIEDFFHSRLAVCQVKKYKKCISRFTNLKYVALNYNCISEDIIEEFSKTLARKLECLNIKVFRNDPHFHRISSYNWKMLKRACPKLKVAFWFESIGAYSEIAPILVNDIPVKDVHLWTGYDEDIHWRLSATVDHISELYASTLGIVLFGPAQEILILIVYA